MFKSCAKSTEGMLVCADVRVLGCGHIRMFLPVFPDKQAGFEIFAGIFHKFVW